MGFWRKVGRVALATTLVGALLACYASSYVPTTSIPNPSTVEPYGAGSSETAVQPETPFGQTPTSLEEVVDENVRLCSWNIENFGRRKIMLDEADDPDVAEGTGRAIAYLMMGCDLTAVQEISDIEGKVIPYFLENYLNVNPPGTFVSALSPRLGRIASGEAQKEQYGFVYDSRKLELVDSFTYDDGTDAFIREPFVGYFRSLSGNLDFVVATIHTKPVDAVEEMLSMEDVVRLIYLRYPGEYDIIVVGDTNLKDGFNTEVGSQWSIGEFYSIIGEDTTLAKSVNLYDQIIIDKQHTWEDFSGLSGVIRFDTGYNFAVAGDDISDHYPVWIELYTNRDTDH
jgi:hypothetical protein